MPISHWPKLHKRHYETNCININAYTFSHCSDPKFSDEDTACGRMHPTEYASLQTHVVARFYVFVVPDVKPRQAPAIWTLRNTHARSIPPMRLCSLHADPQTAAVLLFVSSPLAETTKRHCYSLDILDTFWPLLIKSGTRPIPVLYCTKHFTINCHGARSMALYSREVKRQRCRLAEIASCVPS